jgi:YVTN family beta-propeller protein
MLQGARVMKRFNRGTFARTIAAFVLLASVTMPHATAQEKTGFHVTRTIQVGGEGGWDYITFDAASRRLFASHATQVAVIDADSGTLVGIIPNTPGVHGIAISWAAGKGYISAGRSNSVTVFDLGSLRRTKEIPVGQNPDAILSDPYSKRVFVFNGRGQSASVLSTASDSVIATIPLGGKPEFAVTDMAGKVFVNIEDRSEIAVIDAQTLAVVSRWSVAPGEEPSGLAIDVANHVLFAVCGNEQMVIVRSDNGKVVATVPTGKGTDGCAFDPGLGNAYASNGEGTLTVVHEDSPTAFRVVENAETRRGARTITLDPEKHVVYLPTADFGPAPAATADNPRPRPSIVPGSFVILQMER